MTCASSSAEGTVSALYFVSSTQFGWPVRDSFTTMSMRKWSFPSALIKYFSWRATDSPAPRPQSLRRWCLTRRERGRGQDERETETSATGPPPVARSEVSLSISSGALPPPPFAWRRAGSGPLGVDPDADRRPRLAGNRGDG